MEIKPHEITSILRQRIEGMDDERADLSEVGTVLSIGDGSPACTASTTAWRLEMLELPHDVTGLALNLEQDNVGAVLFGGQDRRGRHGEAHRPPARDPGRRGASAGWWIRSAARSTTRATSTPPRRVRPSSRPPAWSSVSPSKEPVQTGLKAIDWMIPSGADSGADHRRPPDGEDRDRDRHDHQQPRLGSDLHLRGDRAADVDGGAGDGGPRRRSTGEENTILIAAVTAEKGADQVHGAVRRLRDGRALPLQRQARAVHL